MEHWAKNFFDKITLKHLQNTFGHFWERFRALLEFWKFYDFFWKFSKTRPSLEHWAKSFFEKITLKHLQNKFGHFWERFWAFLEFWKFFDFLENFRLDTFGNDFGHFWNFETFLIFLKIFDDSTLLGTLGKKFFRKNHPKTSSKHVWTLLGTILGLFGILKFFWFFGKFSKTRPSTEHWAKSFFEKITLKQLQNTFEHFWERFWACLDFWNFFWFWKFSFGQFWGRFWAFLELWNFLIFLKIFEDSTLHGTLGKKFFEKINLKHLQNTFGHFWERFWAFLEFWKTLDFFEKFRRFDPPWNTGQKVFSKKSP